MPEEPATPPLSSILASSLDPGPRPVFGEPMDPRREALLKRIENDFCYHAPNSDQIQRYALIREKAKQLARIMAENCPISRELSTALTELESAVMNANAAIARNEH